MQNLHKVFLGMILAIGLSGMSHGIEIGVGGRVGMGVGVSTYWPGDAAAMANFLVQVADRDPMYRHNPYIHLGVEGYGWLINLGVYADMRFVKWFSLSPHFQVTFNQFGGEQSELLKQDITMRHSVIDLEILAKFHVGWWYIGVGPGLTINTAPTLKMNNTLTTLLEVAGINLEKKSSTGFNIVLDTGLYIPLGSSINNLTIGLRTSVDIVGVKYFYNDHIIEVDKNNLPVNGIPEGRGKAIFGYTPLSVGLTVGYLHRFQ